MLYKTTQKLNQTSITNPYEITWLNFHIQSWVVYPRDLHKISLILNCISRKSLLKFSFFFFINFTFPPVLNCILFKKKKRKKTKMCLPKKKIRKEPIPKKRSLLFWLILNSLSPLWQLKCKLKLNFSFWINFKDSKVIFLWEIKKILGFSSFFSIFFVLAFCLWEIRVKMLNYFNYLFKWDCNFLLEINFLWCVVCTNLCTCT